MLTVVINAGGDSRRMGENKALKRFAGQVLIERMISRLRPLAQEILITTNHPDPYHFLGLPLIPDLIAGKGALGGLYTALSSAHNPYVVVVACDMPFINTQLLKIESDLLIRKEFDVVVPRSLTGLEPLHAVYRKETCLPSIRAALDKNALRIVSWFSTLKVYEMSPEEIRPVDPDFRSFINVNTPEEFQQAEALENET